jgi:hypothetical protein
MADLRSLIDGAIAENGSLVIRVRLPDQTESEHTVEPRGWDGDEQFYAYCVSESEYRTFDIDSIRTCRHVSSGAEWKAPREILTAAVKLQEAVARTKVLETAASSKASEVPAPPKASEEPTPPKASEVLAPPNSSEGPVDPGPNKAEPQPRRQQASTSTGKRRGRGRTRIGWLLIAGAAVYVLNSTGRLDSARQWLAQESRPTAAKAMLFIGPVLSDLQSWAASAVQELSNRYTAFMQPEAAPTVPPPPPTFTVPVPKASDTPVPTASIDYEDERQVVPAESGAFDDGAQLLAQNAEPTDAPTPMATSEPLPTQTPGRNCPRPEVCIRSPGSGVFGRGDDVYFIGTATHPNFQRYKFEAVILATGNVGTLAEFWTPVESGELMRFDTQSIPPGRYTFRMIVIDNTGNSWPEIAEVDIELQ